MDKRAGLVAKILLERDKISLAGMEISPYKYSQAGQLGCGDESSKILSQAIFNNCQNNKIVPASGMKFSHISTSKRNYSATRLSSAKRLPYKQAFKNYHAADGGQPAVFRICLSVCSSLAVNVQQYSLQIIQLFSRCHFWVAFIQPKPAR